jgi:uncharacterized damage-inducible protein DinB
MPGPTGRSTCGHDACGRGVRGRAARVLPSLAATLNHIYEVDLYYIDALTEGGLGRSVYDRTEDIHDAAKLGAAQAASDARLLAFCRD